MKKVDLSDQSFKSVGITFNNVQYKLFHGDDNDNEALQQAFPQYFEKDREPELIGTIEKEEDEVIEKVIEETRNTELEVGGLDEILSQEYGETTQSTCEESSVEYKTEITEEDDVMVYTPNIPEWFTTDPNEPILKEEVEVDTGVSELPEGISDVKTFDKTLTHEEVVYLLNIPNEEPKEEGEDSVPMGHKVPTIVPTEPSRFSIFIKDMIESSSRVINNTLDFMMSLRFITMTAMFMIAISAIYFDIDGWKETYHRLDGTQVTFIIVSLYVAKMAIIKILSVGVDRESVKGSWTDKLVFYANHYILRTVMIASLLGMISVSSVGIYSSLAVNTVGDVKEVAKGDSKIEFINKRIESVSTRIPLVREQIVNLEKAIEELPENYKTKRRGMLDQINKLNDKIFELQNNKSAIEDEKEKAILELNDRQTNTTNKALNFTAELLGVTLIELLKFINLLMTFVLEITYLSLTWLVVRIDKYSIKP